MQTACQDGSKRVRVVHIITGLNVGGAETVLWRLVTRLASVGFENHVVSLLVEGPIGGRLRSAGIPVYSLGMRHGTPDVWQVQRLIRLLGVLQPDIVQTWMYHANLIGGLACAMAGRVPCVWGVHNTHLTQSDSRLTRFVSWLCARTSLVLPSAIVYCSDSARIVHEATGYAVARTHTIWNGFDSEAFQPDMLARRDTRLALELPPDAQVVGMVARDHPQKDIENYLLAANLLSKRLSRTHFVLCGSGLDTTNQRLARMRDDLGLSETCLLLGTRDDVGALYNVFDVATLTSLGEALPLVIGEAMSCGVPFVATDVGDAARIIGDTGLIAPPHSPEALAEAWYRILSMPESERRALGLRGRERIVNNYSIQRMVQSYVELYHSVLAKNATRPW